MVANPTRGQLIMKHKFALIPFTPENLVSQAGFGRPVPRQLGHSAHPG